MRYVAVKVLCVAFGVAQTHHAYACDALLKGGVWEIDQLKQQTSTSTSFLNWFCSREFSSEQAMIDAAGGVTLPVKLPVQLNGHFKQNNWSNYSKELCRMDAGSYAHADSIETFSRRASEVIARTWLACMNRVGLNASFVSTPDPRQFVVKLNYRGARVGDNSIKIDQFSLTSSGAAQCQFKAPAVISSRTIACRRANARQQVVVTVNSSQVLDNPDPLIVPGQRPITPPPPPKPKRVSREGQIVHVQGSGPLPWDNKGPWVSVKVSPPNYIDVTSITVADFEATDTRGPISGQSAIEIEGPTPGSKPTRQFFQYRGRAICTATEAPCFVKGRVLWDEIQPPQ